MITHVTQATCTVRLLSGKGGVDRRKIAKLGLPSEIVNLKMTRSFGVPHSFFLGAKVMRRFSGKWYVGTVTAVDADEGEVLWQVVYEDFDADQLTRRELAACLVYHPLLNTAGDLRTPAVGSMVWFSQDQMPVLGKVLTVDPTTPRPVVVQVYEPQTNVQRIQMARFRPAADSETGEPSLARLTLHQILINFQQLTSKGYLQQDDRRRLVRCLTR